MFKRQSTQTGPIMIASYIYRPLLDRPNTHTKQDMIDIYKTHACDTNPMLFNKTQPDLNQRAHMRDNKYRETRFKPKPHSF